MDYSLADLKAVTDNDDNGMGGGSWAWMLILLFLFWGFAGGNGGFGGNGNAGSNLTRDELQQVNTFQTLDRKLNDIGDGICSSGYENLAQFSNTNMAIANGMASVNSNIANIGYQAQQCCCETNRNIDSVRYENAKNTCDIITSQSNNTQKILDAISANEIQNLRDKVSDLQLQQSQCSQNAYLVGALRPQPVPAVPYASYYGFGNTCCSC